MKKELTAHRQKIIKKRLINLNKYNNFSELLITHHTAAPHSKSKKGMKIVEKHKTENSKRFSIMYAKFYQQHLTPNNNISSVKVITHSFCT